MHTLRQAQSDPRLDGPRIVGHPEPDPRLDGPRIVGHPEPVEG